MWDFNQLFEQEDAGGRPRKGIFQYTKWANPFKNGVKRFEQASCEGEDLFDITMWYPTVGNWFFTSFVPSPVEIFRKTVTGGYKCGFYLKTKQKAPLDIIWRNGDATRFLAKVARLPVTTAYYMWGQQTLWSGLATWQSLIYKGYSCDGDDFTCITADGAANISVGPDGSGNMPWGLSVFDPNDWHDGFGATIYVPALSNSNCKAFLTVTSAGASLTNLTMRLKFDRPMGDVVVAEESFSLEIGEQKRFALEGTGYTDALSFWTIELEYTGLVKPFPLARVELRLDRAIVRSVEGELPSPCSLWIPGNLDYQGEI